MIYKRKGTSASQLRALICFTIVSMKRRVVVWSGPFCEFVLGITIIVSNGRCLTKLSALQEIDWLPLQEADYCERDWLTLSYSLLLNYKAIKPVRKHILGALHVSVKPCTLFLEEIRSLNIPSLIKVILVAPAFACLFKARREDSRSDELNVSSSILTNFGKWKGREEK